jgi:hypothetical protein
MDLSDEQIESMSSMMNPDFIKSTTDLLKNNPDLVKTSMNM